MNNRIIIFFLILVTFDLTGKDTDSPIIVDLEGLKFELPFKMEMMIKEDSEFFTFNLDSCKYSFVRKDFPTKFYSESELDKFYYEISRSILKTFEASTLIKQEIIEISGIKAVQNEIEFYGKSTIESAIFVVLLMADNYYSFLITHNKGQSCNQSYDMAHVLKTIEVSSSYSKSQIQSRGIFEYIPWKYYMVKSILFAVFVVLYFGFYNN